MRAQAWESTNIRENTQNKTHEKAQARAHAHTLTLVFSYSTPKWKEGERAVRRKVQTLADVLTKWFSHLTAESAQRQRGCWSAVGKGLGEVSWNHHGSKQESGTAWAKVQNSRRYARLIRYGFTANCKRLRWQETCNGTPAPCDLKVEKKQKLLVTEVDTHRTPISAVWRNLLIT